MGARDLRGNVQAEPESVRMALVGASSERLEQPGPGLRIDRAALVTHREFEPRIGPGVDPDRASRPPVGQRIRQEVGKQLADADRIAAHGSRDDDVGVDMPIPIPLGGPHLGDDMVKRALKIGLVAQGDRQSVTQAAAREVEHIVNQTRHPCAAAFDHRQQA